MPKSWLRNLIKDKAESPAECFDENSIEREDIQYSDDDLVMDVLPKSTRFQTKVSLNSFAHSNLDNLDCLTSEFFDESIDQEIALYIQKNSKINLVSMCLDTSSDKYTQDFILKIVSIFLYSF